MARHSDSRIRWIEARKRTRQNSGSAAVLSNVKALLISSRPKGGLNCP